MKIQVARMRNVPHPIHVVGMIFFFLLVFVVSNRESCTTVRGGKRIEYTHIKESTFESTAPHSVSGHI